MICRSTLSDSTWYSMYGMEVILSYAFLKSIYSIQVHTVIFLPEVYIVYRSTLSYAFLKSMYGIEVILSYAFLKSMYNTEIHTIICLPEVNV